MGEPNSHQGFGRIQISTGSGEILLIGFKHSLNAATHQPPSLNKPMSWRDLHNLSIRSRRQRISPSGFCRSRSFKAIAQLDAPDAPLYEPDAAAKGHAAINQAVEALLSHLPPNFAFSANGTAVGHHGIGRLRWQSGPPNGPVAVTGTDVAHFESGRIHSLYVFLDPSGT